MNLQSNIYQEYFNVIDHLVFSILIIILYFVLKYTYNKIYKHDKNKLESVINNTQIFLWGAFFSYFLVYFVDANISIALMIFFTAKVLFQFTSYYIIQVKGKHNIVKDKVLNATLIKKLTNQLNKKKINLNDNSIPRINLANNYYYKVSDACFYKKIEKKFTTKMTRFLDFFIGLFFVIIAIIVVLMTYDGLAKIANNNILVGFFALVFMYMLTRLYIDIYALYYIVKSDSLEMNNVIRIDLNNKRVFGTIYSISWTKVVLKNKFTGAIDLVPVSLFLSNHVKHYPEGYRFYLEYVLDFNYYKDDNGKKLKKNFESILINIRDKKDEKYNLDTDIQVNLKPYVRIVPDNNGVKIILWFSMLRPSKKDGILIDLKDVILEESNKIGYDLRTPKLIEIISEWLKK